MALQDREMASPQRPLFRLPVQKRTSGVRPGLIALCQLNCRQADLPKGREKSIYLKTSKAAP